MWAIILAAGRGSRMKELTEDNPKCLSVLRGKPLLDWQIEALRAGGVTDIAIVTGYRRDALAPWGLREFHNANWQQTNMVQSLAQAAPILGSAPCIVSYSDIFYQPSAIRSLIASDADLAITYDVNWQALWTERFGDPLLDAESFRLAQNGTVADIGGRPTSVEDIQGQYMGLLRIAPKGWQEIQRLLSVLPPSDAQTIHVTGLLQKIIDAGNLPIHAIPYTEPWGEVDSKDDLIFYNDDKRALGL